MSCSGAILVVKALVLALWAVSCLAVNSVSFRGLGSLTQY